MKISAHMQKALNDQIAKEFGASYLYLSMAAYFAERNLNGFASWMRSQAAEETKHAMKIFQYVEEEKTSTEIVDTLRMIGENASGLYIFDKELGKRGTSD